MHFPLPLLTTLLLATTTTTATPLSKRDLSWTIKDFTRTSTDDNSVTYSLGIFTGSATQQCTIVDTASDAPTHAFYDVACQEAKDYHISWGWDTQDDFTVMTVVYEPWQVEAWFGYKSPNVGFPGTISYKDQGPNAVQGTGA